MLPGDWLTWGVLLSVVVLPLFWIAVDALAVVRATRAVAPEVESLSESDFAVLVPIYGSVSYLETADYLGQYGSRVVLCTTTAETKEFYDDLQAVADAHGFRIFRGEVDAPATRAGRRATSGVVRDRLIRDALQTVTAPYVVCLDADTWSVAPLDELVGSIAQRELDLASVRLVPARTTGVLGHLQRHEYRTAMRLRLLAPWLLSGACHAGRTVALADVMRRHSLFFQGNDVEAGILGAELGYRVGHVPFEVLTTVPCRARAWGRQRLAWAGGEVRLFLANPQVARRHPVVWGYGAVVSILMVPLRWRALLLPTPALLTIAVAYWALVLWSHRDHLDRWALLLPLYSAFSSLVITPLGLPAYLRMAMTHHNWGRISVRRSPRAVRPLRRWHALHQP